MRLLIWYDVFFYLKGVGDIHLGFRFLEALKRDISGRGVERQLQLLCNTYALSLVDSHAGDFLLTGYLTSEQVDLAKSQLRNLFAQVCSQCSIYTYRMRTFCKHL